MSLENQFSGGNKEKTAADIEKMNYYDRLGVVRTSSADEIKKAYRKLAQQYHPDANPEKDTTKIMQVLSEAYNELSDSNKRSIYDRKSTNSFSAYSTSGNTRSKNPYSEYDDIFEQFRKQWRNGSDGFEGFSDKGQSHHYTYSQEQKKRTSEEIKNEAIEKAQEGGWYYKTFIAELKREKVTEADQLINSPEIQSIILKNAINKISEGLYYYISYLNEWDKCEGFDRNKINTNKEIVIMIKDQGFKKALEGPYYFGSYAAEVEKYKIFPKADLLREERILESIKKTAFVKAQEGAYYYQSYLNEWNKYGLNRSFIDTDIQILGVINTIALQKKKDGDFYYKSFINEWKKAGIEIA